MEPKRWLYWNGTGQINYRECQLIIRKQTRPICRWKFPQEGSFHRFEMCPTYTNHLKICLYFTGPQMHFRFIIIGLTTHPSGSNFVCCFLCAHNSGCSWNTRHAWYNISAQVFCFPGHKWRHQQDRSLSESSERLYSHLLYYLEQILLHTVWPELQA